MRWFLITLVLLAEACGSSDRTLCVQFYKPYPDIVGQRVRTTQNATFLDAMALYNAGDLAGAAAGLQQVIDKDPGDNMARMYLASSLLGIGEPYKAEMHLDFLERARNSGFKDQTEWYNALCWLCSGQYERSVKQASIIADRPSHTYRNEAQDLVKILTAH